MVNTRGNTPPESSNPPPDGENQPPPSYKQIYNAPLSKESDQPFGELLAKFQLIVELNAWSDTEAKTTLGVMLNDLPLDIFFSLHSQEDFIALTFKQLTDKMCDPISHVVQIESLLDTRKQVGTESPIQYVIQKEKLNTTIKPDMPVDKRIYHILAGLKKNFLDECSLHKFGSVDELKTHIKNNTFWNYSIPKINLQKVTLNNLQTPLKPGGNYSFPPH